MTLGRLARLTGESALANGREDDVRRVILALGRLTYEQGRLDALRELESAVLR
jgi:hypothetical protein